MNRPAICLAALMSLSVAAPSQAALAIFTDRAAWQAASGGIADKSEDFNSYTDDILYGAAPFTAGFLTLSVVAGQFDTSWRIDVLPSAANTIPDVDGSTYLTTIGAGHLGFGDTLMSFAPVRALGFDYAGADYSTVDGVLTTSRGDSFTLTMSGNGQTSFIGLLYSAGETFTSLEWNEGAGPVTFPAFGTGIDNVEAFSAVPLPASGWMLGTVFAALGVGARRRKQSAR